jgi:uncharacterized protein YecE (DUF72 family)
LFVCEADDEAIEIAHRRKPNLPVKRMTTSNKPFIRFVGNPHSKTTEKFLQEWVYPVVQWLDDCLKPYFFTHMPDDLHAPSLGRYFVN